MIFSCYIIIYSFFILYFAYLINILKSNRCYDFRYYCIMKRIKFKIMKYSVITKIMIYDAINLHINFILKYHILGHYYIALDVESYLFMNKYTSNIFLYLHNFTNLSNSDYGTKNYGKIVMCKTKVNNMFLKLKKNILLTDIDIYFFNNPFNSFYNYKEDLIITKDGYSSVNTGL